jgi:hypothetical protein
MRAFLHQRLLLLPAVAGFGKAFMNAGNKQWGVGSMQHDLSDAVAWAVAMGIADPNKVCIMGGSYGKENKTQSFEIKQFVGIMTCIFGYALCSPCTTQHSVE